MTNYYRESRTRQVDRIEARALRRTPQGAAQVTLKVNGSGDMQMLADRGWVIASTDPSIGGLLVRRFVMQMSRDALVFRLGHGKVDA